MESDLRERSLPGTGARLLHGIGTRAIQLFLKLAPLERNRLFALTMLIGGICGLAAVAFHSAIRWVSELLIERALTAPGASWIGWTLLTPTLGALIAGTCLTYVVPNARGSGIPQVKLVYAVKSGRLRLRDSVGKFLVATLQLGTGSALGREGPTVQICAGIASALGRLFAISPNNLRRLIPVGAAAGIAAAFNAPIAAVTFTIEEIIGDLDQTLLSGVVVAAALAAAVEHSVLGEHPVFMVPGSYGLRHPSSLLVYALLGIASALVAHVFCFVLLRLRSRFRQLARIPPEVRPALGGLATGALAVVGVLALDAQGVVGDGYATLSAALAGTLSLKIMLALVLLKLLATTLCYSSGGAGGIFAPVLFIGGMLGGVFGHLDRILLAHPSEDLGAFALVGMGAFFAGVIRAPITSVLIIFEMTRSYGLILPLMIANTVAYGVARLLHPVAIYEALLEQDGLRLPQTQRTLATMSAFRVSDAMTTEVVSLKAEARVADALERVNQREFSVYPVLDANEKLVGLVSEARLRRCAAEGRADALVGAEARVEAYLHGDMPLVDAITAMTSAGTRQVAVVDSAQEGKLIGMLAMSDIMRAHADAARGPSPLASSSGPSARPAVHWRRRDSATSVPKVNQPPPAPTRRE